MAPNATPPRRDVRPSRTRARSPLLWSGVLFALAANVLVVNLVQRAIDPTNLSLEWIATMVGPFWVGVATAFYVRQRGGMHAFVGGVLSIPLLVYSIFGGNWQYAIFAGAFCAMGGAVTELFRRAR